MLVMPMFRGRRGGSRVVAGFRLHIAPKQVRVDVRVGS